MVATLACGSSAWDRDGAGPGPARGPADGSADRGSASPGEGRRHDVRGAAGGRRRPDPTPHPAAGIDSAMVPLGLTADGALAVPTGDARDLAGWFTGGPRPGEVGPAVLSGHVTQGGEPSVFHRLAEVRPGTTVLVDRDDGTTASFETLRSERHPKESFPSSEVYGDVAEPQLRLITCGGEVDDATGRHRDNVIVFARLVAVRASTDGRSSTARGRRARRPGPLSPRAP